MVPYGYKKWLVYHKTADRLGRCGSNTYGNSSGCSGFSTLLIDFKNSLVEHRVDLKLFLATIHAGKFSTTTLKRARHAQFFQRIIEAKAGIDFKTGQPQFDLLCCYTRRG